LHVSPLVIAKQVSLHYLTKINSYELGFKAKRTAQVANQLAELTAHLSLTIKNLWILLMKINVRHFSN
jgi:hypothetical protein